MSTFRIDLEKKQKNQMPLLKINYFIDLNYNQWNFSYMSDFFYLVHHEILNIHFKLYLQKLNEFMFLYE